MSGLPDVFGLDRLRAAALRAWRDSPTRLTEDTNAERDLRVGGYRDRLFVELAQNAADAAALAGTTGHVRVTVVGDELRVANTGAPLDADGVAALASLRASAKPEGAVGRFGVGFAAVLAVTTEPRVVSRTGGVVFSEERTRIEAGADDVPVLRLPWEPDEHEPPPPDGFDTEVRLPLRVPAAEVTGAIAGEVADLLLALPWLQSVEVEGRRWSRSVVGDVVELSTPDGTTRWSTHVGGGAVWALPVDADGTPRPQDEDVLHTPTPTDERLSLPARLLAPVPVEPSRRRVLAGGATREALAAAARAYPDLVRGVSAEHRLSVMPPAGFPLSEVDSELRGLVLGELSEQDWVPAAAGGELPGVRVRVLEVDAPDLAAALAEVVPGLAAACGPGAVRALEAVGADAVGVADAVDAMAGLDREPSWWRRLYETLLDAVDARRIDPAELGALPVPLVDGRTVPGPRGALVVDATSPAEELGELDVVGLHLVHPDAAHPLLHRLGAVEAGPAEVLDAPALREAVERSVEDAVSGVDVLPFVEAVVRLAGSTSASGLGALALPARSGWRRADELVLPGAAVRDVLDPDALGEDAPLDVLDETFADRHGPAVLAELGVLETFAIVADDDPVDADHDLPDERAWWDAGPPSHVYAVRDLDLVADGAWPAAIRLLAERPETWRALTTPGGHTPWWLARYALLAGAAPLEWRMPDARAPEGLFDPVPDVGLSTRLLTAVGVRGDLSLADADDAADLCDRLADPGRDVPLGTVLRAHAALASADVDVAPPDRVRTVDGSVVDVAGVDVAGADVAGVDVAGVDVAGAGVAGAGVVVLDGPWLLGVLPAGRVVAGDGDPAALAEVLDLPQATSVASAVVGAGEFAAWTDLPAIVEVAGLLGVSLPDGGVVVHERLAVDVDAGSARVDVSWWCERGDAPGDDVLHAADTSAGLARAFAWAAGLWQRRRDVEALLDDPDPRTLLA